MKATRTVKRTSPVTETVRGRQVSYLKDHFEEVPRIPFNLDAALRKALFTLALAMTLGAIVWGTVAIGSMLGMLAPSWAAYLVAGVFDAGWAGCLIAEWLLRYNDRRAALPRRAGIAMLAVSMAAIILHGSIEGSVLVGIAGALVSAVAKGTWAIGMYTVRVKLNQGYQTYLDDMEQEGGAELALAQREWDRELTRDRTIQLRAALAARRGPVTTVEQITNVPEQFASTPEPVPAVTANTALNREFAVPEPVREQPSIAELVREHLPNTTDNKAVVDAVMAAVPAANAASVAATVRRERKKFDGPYL